MSGSKIALEFGLYCSQFAKSRCDLPQYPSSGDVIDHETQASPFTDRATQLEIEENEIECGLAYVAVQRGQRVTETCNVGCNELVGRVDPHVHI